MRKDDKLIFCMPRKGDIWVMLNQRCGAVSAVCTLLVLLCYKVNTLALIFLVAGKGERYAEGDEASPAGFFSSVGAPAKLSG